MGEINTFWKGKKVFITGHTGFKGSWLSMIMLRHGANIKGFSKDGFQKGTFYNSLDLNEKINSVKGDITNFSLLEKELEEFSPDIIFHLAAQPLVLESYEDPKGTYDTNVIGTLNVLEIARTIESIKSIVSVTTDKVYLNREWDYSYRENDTLGGHDPYSSSKAAADILTNSYKKSFFEKKGVGLCSVRAGNVIGGGDFSENRILPDIIKAVRLNKSLEVRYPDAIRPWQHVIEPLMAYIEIAEKQFSNPAFGSSWNVGPDSENSKSVKYLLDFSADFWKGSFNWHHTINENFHEAGLLRLDSSLLRSKTNWRPVLNIDQTLERTLNWYKGYLDGTHPSILCDSDIEFFYNE